MHSLMCMDGQMRPTVVAANSRWGFQSSVGGLDNLNKMHGFVRRVLNVAVSKWHC
jgi:hypothetical protein